MESTSLFKSSRAIRGAVLILVLLLGGAYQWRLFRATTASHERLMEQAMDRMLAAGRAPDKGMGFPNITWLRGIGEVTSAQLLRDDGQLLGVYQAFHRPKGSQVYRSSATFGGVTAKIEARLPGWSEGAGMLPLAGLVGLLTLTLLPVWPRGPKRDTQETAYSSARDSLSAALARHALPALESPGWATTARALDLLCSRAAEAVVLFDSSGAPLYCNEAMSNCLRSQQRPSKNLLLWFPPEQRHQVVEAVRTVSSSVEGSREVTFVVQCSDGAQRSLRGKVTSLSPDRGVLGVFTDVTELTALVSELAESRERASQSQKVEALGRLAGGVAHDFNNLLSAIVLSQSAAVSSLPSNHSAQGALSEIGLAARKAKDLTSQLLLYSRKKTSEPELVPCHQLIEETRRITAGLLGEVAWDSQLGATTDLVLAEPGQLDQIVMNLVLNARDACEPEGLIKVRTEDRRLEDDNILGLPPGRYIAISVTDNGGGVPVELQTKILEPYFTTKPVGKGTGLGLSTVVAVIEKTGGRLNLTSQPGETTFEVVLPISLPEVSNQEIAEQTPLASRICGKGPESNGWQVLLAEDDDMIRGLVQRLLKRAGFGVTGVSNGSEAREALSRGDVQHDILVTDLLLPGMPGTAIAEEFNAHNPQAPVIFISGYPGDSLCNVKLNQRCRFLGKPFAPDELIDLIRQLLSVSPQT